MSVSNPPLLAFNRGIVSSTALARVDVDRVRLSAEVMTNWLPKTQGAMILRPGFGYLSSTRNDAFGIGVPFVAATDDTALIEFADSKMRVRIDDTLISRTAVSTAVTTGDFSSATGWTEANTGGGDCTFGGSGLTLNATNIGGLALCRQQVTVSGGDANIEHALEIIVTRGPVTFRCGSSSGADDYVRETTLRTGSHSLAFTPTGSFWVQFQSDLDVNKIVASCQVAGSGTMELTSPYAAADLPYLRWDQSADVVFMACDGYQQRRIERRGAGRSWSLVLYQPNDGPFFGARSARVKLKVGATYGNTTLTADRNFFKAEHVGSLFRLFNTGYKGTFSLAAEGAFTEPIRVTGIKVPDSQDDGGPGYNDRLFGYTVSGTWLGTLEMQRSFDGEDTGFNGYRYRNGEASSTNTTFTANGTYANDDSDSNAIVWYRVGFNASAYTFGAAVITWDYDGGGGYGVCRVLAYNSATSVDVEVIDKFNSTAYTDDWQEGLWSDHQGWPSTVALHRGRLWWIGKSRFVGSVSDDYESFDPDYEGNAGPINRTLGTGPVDTINFALSLSRLIAGTSGAEYSIKSTSFDEPLTPDNAQAGDPSTQGSRQGVTAAKIDNRGIFAQRSGRRLFELVFNPDSYEYEPRDLTLLCPDLTGDAKIVGLAVQRQPDTRVHVWLDDGTVVLLTYEPQEEVVCWSRIEPADSGFVEHVAVLPGEDEDQVYYWVKRTVNSSTKRYIEKMALESECIGSTTNKQADAFKIVTGVTGTSVTGLSHLEGKSVVAWASGQYKGTYTVSGGAITLSAAVTAADVMVGLAYQARYKSTKLAYSAVAGTALTQKKRVNFLGVVMGHCHNDGLYFGRGFDNLDPLPMVKDGVDVTEHQIFDGFDEPAFPFPGSWDTDSRLCLVANAPKPCELMAAVVTVETNERR